MNPDYPVEIVIAAQICRIGRHGSSCDMRYCMILTPLAARIPRSLVGEKYQTQVGRSRLEETCSNDAWLFVVSACDFASGGRSTGTVADGLSAGCDRHDGLDNLV